MSEKQPMSFRKPENFGLRAFKKRQSLAHWKEIKEMTFAHRSVTQHIGLSPIILTELQFCRRPPNVALLNVPFCLQVFHANADATEVVLNRIPQPVLARFVRIKPQTWKNGIALRFELYGCQITGKTDDAFLSCGVSQTFSGQGVNLLLGFQRKHTSQFVKCRNMWKVFLYLCNLIINRFVICPSINSYS